MLAVPLADFDDSATPLPRASDRVGASGTESGAARDAAALPRWEPTALPSSVPLAWLQRGEQLHQRQCAGCHGDDGRGRPIPGLRRPPPYDAARLRQADDLRLFDVLTHGSGTMGSFAQRLSAADRWAVIAYVRALQQSSASQRAHQL